MIKKKILTNSYWNKFYKDFKLNKPSNFAKFVKKKIKKNSSILDVGCGNGRDTFFFLKDFSKVVGIDKSETAIKNNAKKFKDKFHCFNICKKIKNLNIGKFDNIYARFYIHAISENDQEFFFLNIKKIAKKNTRLFLEFRTIKDPMYKYGKKISKYERLSSHYRRFIDLEKFERSLKGKKFKIIYKKTSFNFAKYKNQKPHICRMIITKLK